MRLGCRSLANVIVTALCAVGGLACDTSPFEVEAHGAALPVQREARSVEAAPVAAAADYAAFGRSIELPEGRRFDWPASGLRARFRGKALRIVLDAHGHDQVAVDLDGAPFAAAVALRSGANEILVPAPDREEHVVELGKRTEAREGYFVVRAVTAMDGELLPLAPRRRLEVVGDSISAGFGVEPSRADGTCAFVSHEQNALASYASLFSRARKLDLTLIAVSSKTTREMTQFFERAWPNKSAPLWSFGEPPSAVVVLLGTNDFFRRDPGKATFVHDTLALLGRVRAHYGAATPVVMSLSPMLSDFYPHGARHRTLARRYLEAAKKRANAEGERNLFMLEFEQPSFEQGWGCSSHPSAATHQAMAEKLSRFFDEEHVVR